MGCTGEERLDTGKQIYNNESGKSDAAVKYGISEGTSGDNMRLYRDANGLPTKNRIQKEENTAEISIHSSEPDLSEYESLTKEELIKELVKSRISEARLKKDTKRRGWRSEDSYSLRQLEYEIMLELSGEFPVRLLCESMEICRNSFCYWKKRLSDPARKTKMPADSVILFREYHMKYPSHGYRWLNAEIRLDTGLKVSDPYAHRCCKTAVIKSRSKHYRYKKPGGPRKVYPDPIPAGLKTEGPMQCIVSDMTAFRVKGVYYELTLYMDLWNNEILSHSLSAKRGDRMAYISGPNDLIKLKKDCP